jgi:hypothetical protein
VEEYHGVVVVDDECEGAEEEENEDFETLIAAGLVARLEPRFAAGGVVLVPGDDEAEGTEYLGVFGSAASQQSNTERELTNEKYPSAPKMRNA